MPWCGSPSASPCSRRSGRRRSGSAGSQRPSWRPSSSPGRHGAAPGPGSGGTCCPPWPWRLPPARGAGPPPAGPAGGPGAEAADRTPLAGLLGVAAAELVLVAALALVRRALLVAAYDLVADAVRGATARRTASSA